MIALALIILASICKAVADTLAHHFDTSIFKNKNPVFWNPVVSSEKAKRIFGWKYDAWHLANSGMIVCFIAAITLHDNWLDWYWEVMIGGVVFNATFNVFYNKLLR